jgi:hypothetical protein
LVKETGVPEKKHWPIASHWQTLLCNVSSTPRLSGIWTHKFVVICTHCIGICTPNYHTTTTDTRKIWYPKCIYKNVASLNWLTGSHPFILC